MKKIRIMSIFGTRPEAIKMAPLLLELQRRPEIESIPCLTAQHREMLDSVMHLFGLSADYDLNIMEPGQTLSTVTAKALTGLGRVLDEARPDFVFVHGDTTTCFTAALAAFYAKIPVGHVEAGLRSGDVYSPYPEEMNRKLTGQIAALHFAPTAGNAENLRREGITDGIFVTGNTVIDAMRYTIDRFPGTFGNKLDDIDWPNRRIITLTCHRRENYGTPMQEIFKAAKTLVDRHPDIELVYPVHPAPAVREAAQAILGGTERIHLIAPLDTVQMHALLARSCLVLTDSGGLQEEAPALGKPVLVLRKETERPEAITAGTARLAGVAYDNILHEAERLLLDPTAYAAMANAVNPYGDGHAAERIVDAVLWRFGGMGERPGDFRPL
ncbi:MAG: UDP-N-acetylglucosamine 2-epimerase (non-hydrolyzing) [Oscillospiraceae bacterium]|nr:UDP-N-acetylglucosamine 2-epimerase (non-hydrolyzing) [Oscillospiraceae bacterium]